MINFKKLKEIKGDASIRRFYRNKKNKSIIVFASKEKAKNLLAYDAVNKILIKNDILAPKLISQNFKNHYIEVDDFGEQTLYKILKNKKIKKYAFFQKIIKTLNNLQLIKDKNIINFKNENFHIKAYNKKILFNEANLFSKWYAFKKLSKLDYRKFKKVYCKEIKILLSKLNFQNNTLVHRDFHVSNLMYFEKNIAVIDSQDALIGNKAYDLASLIDDVRLRTSIKLKDKVLAYYLKKLKKNELKKFKNDFEILSVLRNLKIIGTFMRLAIRDNKKKYLKLIPYAWEMIRFRMDKNTEFTNLKFILGNNFPKFIV